MDQQTIRQMIGEADEDLAKAREELYRPSGDVVNYAACVFARRALHRSLECLYLLLARANNDEPDRKWTIEEMAAYCRTSDERMQKMDFNFLNCRDRTELGDKQEFYCNEPEKVGECLQAAEKIRDLVRNIPGGSGGMD